MHEEKSLTKGLDDEDAHIDNLKEVLDNVNKLTDPSQGLSLGQFAQMFKDLQVKFFMDKLQYSILTWFLMFLAKTLRGILYIPLRRVGSWSCGTFNYFSTCELVTISIP